MFESAEVGEKLDKASFAAQAPRVRAALLDAQAGLPEAGLSVVVVIAGAEGAGKGETVNFFLNWLDVRGVETHGIGAPTEEEVERPPFYRFWRRLPPKGKIAIFFGSWYTQPIVRRIDDDIDDARFDQAMHQIVEFERMLASEGTLLLKVWLHITKKQQRKNFKELEAHPDTAWRVTSEDWRLHKTYDRFIEVSARAIRQTSSGHAPWTIVEAADKRYRHMAVAEKLVEVIQARISVPAAPPPPPQPLPRPRDKNIINSLDLKQSLSESDYERELSQLQGQLGQLSRKMTRARCAAVLVFEGADAAGKGGCIRRIVESLDARFYGVIPIGAPTDEELARPYLWRFWRTLPRRGHFRIYDRSWYGRVLVERIEGLCRPEDWQRAYAEINAFEGELADFGFVILKFWLAISNETQLARFNARQETSYKRYKITTEDWRNRDKWLAYEAAACDMIEQTSTELAPWSLIEAEDKHFARIKVLRTTCERLREAIEQSSFKKSKKGRGGDKDS
jgi:polyphosphate:AMP phosphotransferase